MARAGKTAASDAYCVDRAQTGRGGTSRKTQNQAQPAGACVEAGEERLVHAVPAGPTPGARDPALPCAPRSARACLSSALSLLLCSRALPQSNK